MFSFNYGENFYFLFKNLDITSSTNLLTKNYFTILFIHNINIKKERNIAIPLRIKKIRFISHINEKTIDCK